MYLVPILMMSVLVVLISAWSFKKRRRNSRRRDKCNSHDGTGNEQETRNTRSIERHPQPKPDERRLQALEAKVRSLESQLQEKEKENRKLKKQALRHERKKRARKENIRKYREKNKEVRKATAEKKSDAPGKRTGKPPGSAGGGFTLPPGEPDVVKDWVLDRCPLCGTKLKGVRSISSWDHTIIDLVRPKGHGGHGLVLEVTRHHIHRYRCPGCKKLVHKDFGALKNAHYGVGMIAFVMAERIENRATWSSVAKTLRRVLRHDALVPTVVAFIQWMQRYEPQVRQVYEAIRASIKESAFAHVDETGIPKDGANWWMWVVVTGHVVLFLQDASRGHQVIKDIFDGYKGILLSDFWTAYNCLDVQQQKCLTHVVKNLKDMAHDALRRADKARKLLASSSGNRATASNIAAPARRGRPRKKSEPLTAEQMASLEATVREQEKAFSQISRLHEFFSQAWGDGDMGCRSPATKRISIDDAIDRMRDVINAIRDEGVANKDIERLLKRLEKFAPALFTFLEHPEVPPDNNPAERALRHFVKQRNVSGNFISDAALRVYTMHLSLYLTCVKRGIDYDKILGLLLQGETGKIMSLLGLPGSGQPPDRERHLVS